jgi:hypothetical protein
MATAAPQAGKNCTVFSANVFYLFPVSFHYSGMDGKLYKWPAFTYQYQRVSLQTEHKDIRHIFPSLPIRSLDWPLSGVVGWPLMSLRIADSTKFFQPKTSIF